jgi:hypothetical protein
MGSLMPWGYWKIDINSNIARPKNSAGQTVPAIPPEEIKDFDSDYLLVGCEPDKMFKPEQEPEGFRWWWWDNSMMPHLRYRSASNPKATKHWSRLTHCGWAMPFDEDGECLAPIDHRHRDRVNRQLHQMSAGQHKDISDIWGGCVDTRPTKQKKILIIRSSDRNYREFYNTTWDQWFKIVSEVLLDYGFQIVVRAKVPARRRPNNQITDQLIQSGCDCVIANHSAGLSEAVIAGYPVITTSPWNPARLMATNWADFVATGELKMNMAHEIDDWVTRICAYTYNRPELDSLSWIDVHPDADHLRAQKR